MLISRREWAPDRAGLGRGRRWPLWTWSLVGLVSHLSCSWLVDSSALQCRSHADCRARGSGYDTCSPDGVCVHGTTPQNNGPDPAAAPPGCFRGTPQNDSDFLNQCTRAQFLKFDNCERLRLCDDTTIPTVDPPPAPPVTPPDTGPVAPPTVGCYDPQLRSKVIFMQGSTNFTPFIQAMAPLVARSGYVIVWQPTSSCAGAAAGGFDATPGKNLMKNPTGPGQSYASVYDASGMATPCLLGNSPSARDSDSEPTDVGQSDVFASSCQLPAGQAAWVPGAGPYADVAHYTGPIQAMVFVVPPSSTQRVISAEAARMIFGMGGNKAAARPWIDPAFMYIRGSTTGTNNILSRAIDVDPTKWWGVDKRSAPAMQAALLTASADTSEKTIGMLSIDFADRVKDSLHILSFQAKGQLAGFLPDSTPSSRDKLNVRDGHYSPWGPIHLYTRLVGGQPTPQAAAFILPFNVPDRALIDATIAGGSVPVCAMRVTRDREMGPLKAFSPSFQCHCYYERKVNGGNDCTPCEGAASCPEGRPACNLGFCEVD
jgi:hypothetical protein